MNWSYMGIISSIIHLAQISDSTTVLCLVACLKNKGVITVRKVGEHELMC